MYLAHATIFSNIIDTSDFSHCGYVKCVCTAKLHLHWTTSKYRNINPKICIQVSFHQRNNMRNYATLESNFFSWTPLLCILVCVCVWIFACWCLFVCWFVCVSVCVWVFVYEFLCVSVCAWVFVCECLCVGVCVFDYAWVLVCGYLWVSVWVSACVWVCSYVCAFVLSRFVSLRQRTIAFYCLFACFQKF